MSFFDTIGQGMKRGIESSNAQIANTIPNLRSKGIVGSMAQGAEDLYGQSDQFGKNLIQGGKSVLFGNSTAPPAPSQGPELATPTNSPVHSAPTEQQGPLMGSQNSFNITPSAAHPTGQIANMENILARAKQIPAGDPRLAPMGMHRPDAAAPAPAPVAAPTQAPPDYSQAIAGLVNQASVNGDPSSFDSMLAAKHARQGAQSSLGAIAGLQTAGMNQSIAQQGNEVSRDIAKDRNDLGYAQVGAEDAYHQGQLAQGEDANRIAAYSAKAEETRKQQAVQDKIAADAALGQHFGMQNKGFFGGISPETRSGMNALTAGVSPDYITAKRKPS
jgi:hypothetical protein